MSTHAEGSALLRSFVIILQSKADMFPPNPVLCKLCLELAESQGAHDMTGVLLTCKHSLPEHAVKKAL